MSTFLRNKSLNLVFISFLLVIGGLMPSVPLVGGRKGPPLIEDEEVRGFKFALSATYLTHLALAEIHIYNDIKNYVSNLNTRLDAADLYITSYEETSHKDILRMNETQRSNPKGIDWKQAMNIAINPINAFRMIRRFVKELVPLEKYLKDSHQKSDMIERLGRLKKQGNFPNEDDLTDAMEGLLILQDFYDLKSKEISRGKLIAKETHIKLNARHCLEMAKTALNKDYYIQAIEWVKTAEEISTERGPPISPEEFEVMYNLIVTKHDENFMMNMERSHPHMYISKLSSVPEFNSPSIKTMKEVLKEKYLGNLTNDKGQQTDVNFMAICRGDEFISEKKRSRLFCYLDYKKHPWFTIMPLKTEVLSKNPFAVVVYDVVPKSWMQKLIRTAWPVVRRVPNTDATRTPTYAWFTPQNFPTIPIERRLEMVLNFKTVADDLQINAYASGAYVMPHLDFYDNEYGVPGALGPDRLMATALIYLTDVEEGGQTAFTSLGVAAKPIKGSVLFWYTILRNGDIDKRTMHASCPVAYGHKWITTKWVHTNDNFQTRPCLLNKNKSIDYVRI